MSHWLNISCAYTRGIAAYICKIWSFYDQTCHWEGCTQTPTPTTTTTDRAWLHRPHYQMSQKISLKKETNLSRPISSLFSIDSIIFSLSLDTFAVFRRSTAKKKKPCYNNIICLVSGMWSTLPMQNEWKEYVPHKWYEMITELLFQTGGT